MDFIIGNNRHQGMLLPDCIEDYVDENNPVRVIDAYVDTLDFENLGFNTVSYTHLSDRRKIRRRL